MRYIYDGSLEGLFSLIFNQWKNILQIEEIIEESDQLDFFSNFLVKTDQKLYERVKAGIIRDFSYRFFIDIRDVHRSFFKNRALVIARSIKKLYQNDYGYLNSADPDLTEFRKILKRIRGEAHTYKGLLRFEESNGFLLAKMEPENEILENVFSHFKRRMPNESFVIADVKRNKAMINHSGRSFLLDFYESEQTREEDFYEGLWRSFYKSISIEERTNLKLKKSNMPMKYWKYLVELRDEDGN